jgi:hypothetical protein
VSHSAPAQNHEERLSFPPASRPVAAVSWTLPQPRLLAALEHLAYPDTSITELCRLAGFSSRMPW